MPRGEHQRLLVSHLAQKFHRDAKLGPVGKYRSIPTVRDELVGVGHSRIEVVHNHEHDGSSLPAFCGIRFDGVCLHCADLASIRTKPMHVDMSILPKLGVKLLRQLLVHSLGKVAEGIGDCLLCFFAARLVRTLRCVGDIVVVRLRVGGQRIALKAFCEVRQVRDFLRVEIFDRRKRCAKKVSTTAPLRAAHTPPTMTSSMTWLDASLCCPERFAPVGLVSMPPRPRYTMCSHTGVERRRKSPRLPTSIEPTFSATPMAAALLIVRCNQCFFHGEPHGYAR